MQRVSRTKRQPGLISRALSTVFDTWWQARDPEQALKRKFWREHGEKFAAMSAASLNRTMSEWKPTSGDANAVTLDDMPLVRDRSRDLALNDPIAQAVRRTMADHVIGRGLKPQCLVDYERLGISEQQAQDWQAECERHFERSSCEADVTGRVGFAGLLRLIYLSAWDGGDVFVSFPMTQGLQDPRKATRIDLIEAERVDTPPGKFAEPRVNGGVETDENGRPIAFHVYKGHPGDKYGVRDRFNFERRARVVNGRTNVVQVYHQERIGQARGIPGIAQAMPMLDHVSNYCDEVQLAARVHNAMSFWIETAGNPLAVAQSMRDNPYEELAEMGVRAGSVNILRKGDTPHFLGPTAPSAYFDPFVVRMLRIIASSIGAPYEIVFGDVGGANYSSIRAAFQSFRKKIAGEQDMLIPALDAYWFHTIYEAWLDGLLGKVGLAARFEDMPAEWARVTWIRPAPGYIDPTKEVQAYKLAVDSRFMSRTQVIAETGGNRDDVFQQIAEEEQMLEELGITATEEEPAATEPAPAGKPPADGPAEEPETEDEPAKTETAT